MQYDLQLKSERKVMETQQVLVHSYEKPLGGWGRKYEPQGPAHLPIMISHCALRDLGYDDHEWPTRIELDGLPLRYLPGSENEGDCFVYDAALYVRIDGRNWLAWVYYRVRRPLLRLVSFVYERTILTLHVWGLARYPRGCRPSWRDINLFTRKRGQHDAC